jgi:hypothetical protein
MHVWFSGPRILNGLVRPGISLGREDFGPPRLPSWRRHELRAAIQAAAKGRGEALTKTDCDYLIDKGLATGQIDSAGGVHFKAVGFTAEEVAAEIEQTAAIWGQPVAHTDALKMAANGIRAIKRRRVIVGLAVFFWALTAAIVAIGVFT